MNLLLRHHWGPGQEKVQHYLFFIRRLLPTNCFTDPEELDSYLYQTVGQDAIEFVASALGVPLYRRVITGDAVEQGVEYGDRKVSTGIEGDETEDLLVLLSTIKVPFAFHLAS